jgi:hypothetical protein
MKPLWPVVLLILTAACSKPEPALPAVQPGRSAQAEPERPRYLDDCAERAVIETMTLNEAERVLRCTRVFAYGGMPDKTQVRAFNLLFQEPNAVARFRSLSQEAETAGKLYALAGLLLLDNAEGRRLAGELAEVPETLTERASDVVITEQSVPQLVAGIVQRRLGHELRNAGRQWERETGLGTPSFCGAHASSLPPSGPRLPPRDEAATRQDFLAFRRRLHDIVARKETAGMLQVAYRVQDLENYMTNPAVDFWGDFGGILAMGGTFDDQGRFTAPYVYSTWPGEFDAIDCMAVTARDVPLRQQPSGGAPVLARLDYDIVEAVRDDADTPGWEHVRLANGVSGFVASRFVRSPTDFREVFALRGGVWRLTAFIYGG